MIDFGAAFRNITYSAAKVRKCFPDAAMSEIERAISVAESEQSCDIRFVVEGGMPLHFSFSGRGSRTRALELFSNLGVWDTEENNGVLFYILLAERSFEIVADRGVTKKLKESDWLTLATTVKSYFTDEKWMEGAVRGVRELSGMLQPHFPAKEKKNELPNKPVVLV